MWGAPEPSPNSRRSLPRLGLGLWFTFRAEDKARSLRRSASRMSPGVERDAKVAAAAWLKWASEHPPEAVRQVERSYDSLVHPPLPPADAWWV